MTRNSSASAWAFCCRRLNQWPVASGQWSVVKDQESGVRGQGSGIRFILCAVVFVLYGLFRAQGAEAGEAPAAAVKVGVVDIDKMLGVLVSWQDTQTRLQARQAEIEKSLGELKKEIDRVQAELGYFKEGSRDYEQRKQQLAARQQEFLQKRNDAYGDLSRQEQAAGSAIREEIGRAVREYAVAQRLDVVVDVRAVLYVADASDISLAVAREMNKRYKEMKEKANAKPSEDRS